MKKDRRKSLEAYAVEADKLWAGAEEYCRLSLLKMKKVKTVVKRMKRSWEKKHGE